MPEAEGGSTFDGSTAQGSFPDPGPPPPASPRLAATVLCHPDLARVGQRALLGAAPGSQPVAISRLEPRFYEPSAAGAAPPGSPLGDRQLSREGLALQWENGNLALDPLRCPHPLRLDGRPLAGRTAIAFARLGRGVVLEIADRVALLLHVVQLNEAPAPGFGLAGESAAVAELRRQIARMGPTPWPVLLRGETGTGKELAARALHQASRRAGPFLAVNMAALPAELAAAELFGARRGAFTSATADRRGLCAAADGGTLFLDEIGEAPLELQALLLRALETGEVLPVGSDKPQRIDVRFLAATDADLESAIAEGRFRAPLLHRLAGLKLEVPPLRERRDDVPRLFLHFLDLELRQLGRGLQPPADGEAPWLTPEGAARLALHDWPGNVRELRNLARQAAAFGPEAPLELAPARAPVPPAGAPAANPPGPPKARHADDLERPEVLAALAEHRYEVKAAAAALGLSRNALYAVLDRLGLPAGAGGLEAERIAEALSLAGGDLPRAAKALGVSGRALSRRLSELQAKAPAE